MSDGNHIQAGSKSLAQMLQQGRFIVPPHQRYYDWEAGHVQTLLEDVEEAVTENRSCHFLGNVMLIPQNRGEWLINDGQQRVVTFLLICAWLCRAANDTGDGRTEAQMLQLMFDLDSMHSQTLENADDLTMRLSPPSMDEPNFKLLMRGDIIGANGKMTAAWEAIEDFFNAPHRQERQWQEEFADFFRNKLLIVEIVVDQTLDPNAVFEVLNHRGKKLEDVDLIKNHFFSFLNDPGEEEKKDTVEKRIKGVYSSFRDIRAVSAYVRCRLQVEFGYLRGGKDQFYPDVKKHISQNRDSAGRRDCVYDLVGKLAKSESIALFQTIRRPSLDDGYLEQLMAHSATTNKPRNIRHFLGDLRGYSIAQPAVFALLCLYSEAAEGDKKARAKIASKCCQFLSSYLQRVAHTQGDFKPSAYEADLAKLAYDVGHGNCASAEQFLDNLKTYHAADLMHGSNYLEQMKGIVYRSPSKAKYILARMVEYQQPDVECRDAHITVEHILPKGDAHARGWQFTEDDRLRYTDRLGNLTILHRRDNKPQARHNKDFAAKKEIYDRCSYEITKALGKYDDWKPATVEDRQAKLAKLAAEIWNFR